ncbi:hypothetical protein ILYODFUR_006230 [Ilyodon furcidens]|uniref:DUF3715 domain-containing protein n=1 Tax=Ilyodon furcidens TaxID=33524 RepID=A0ABV0SYA4_9TELE
MESRNGGASSEGFLIPVSESSDAFQSKILAPLQSAYLYEESKQFFRYKSAVLVKNPDLENKYEAFRAGKRNAGYSEDDLKETYCFLLFEDGSKANALGEMGVISGNSTCTTLGDPTKGVYISMYSDCLDLNRWYHGKSGYIAIIKLTKGKVRKVAENYTQNFTEPTVGFDCHVSEQLPSVSAKTSSFLAFERTQFYIYELLQDGSSGTSQSPSAACPFAIVSFSYMDTKASPVPQQRSEVKKQVRHYLPWRGKLQLENQCYHIDLRSTAVGFIPAQLPSVITVNQAISMSVLRNILPRAVFETCYDEEVFLEGFYCDLCEFGPSGTNEASSFALLLSEIKEKDLAFCIPLNDGGFLILMHSSHFLRYDDAESASAEVMQGLFVFPDSRVVRKDIKFGEKNSALSSQIQLVLPVLSYAEGEAEKTSMDPKDDLCEVLAHHMQSYATLINPGFSSSPFRPSRELSIFPDQYDVAEAHKHLYSSPEWNNGTWQTFKSYLSKPASFQIPVAKVSQILASGQEERREDLDDDVYICVSSPEEAPSSPVCVEAEDPISDEQSLGNIETSMDIGLPSAELQIAPTPVSQSAVEDNVQSKNITKDDLKCTPPTEQPNKPDDPRAEDPLTPPTSEDLPTELIVSITSAEQSVPDEVSAAKHTDFRFSGLSTMAKLPAAEVNSVIESDKAKQCLDFSVVTKHQTRTKRRRRRRRCSLARKKISKTSVKTQSLKIAISSVEVEHLSLKAEEHNEDAILPQLRNSLKPKWKKLHRRKRRFGKLSSKKRKLRPAAVDSTKARKKKSDAVLESSESTIFLGVEALPLRKKTERWDLKPVISECGRILFPFGCGDQVKSMPCTKMDECLERSSHEVPVTFPDPVITNKQLGTALETAIDETTATNSINGEDHQLDLGDIILTPPDDDGGGVPLTSNFCTAFPRNYDTNGLSKTDETGSPVSLSAKGELLLSKLKSVLSRRKRKLDLTIKEQKRENADQESQSCFKKTKVDPETPKDSNATPQSVNVSKMPSVDPLFAYYLGLTPKENLENVQNTKELNTLKRKGSTEKDEHTSLDKQPQIIQRPLSIFSRRRRIKTLKRHPFISAENVKKKWWLHVQTPAGFTSEKRYNDCTNDNTVRKTVKEKMKSTCTSTDALNLLADLALSNDKVQPQPNQALERTLKESMKKCDLSKGLSSSDQESLLHALLRNPSAIALQSPESPSACSTVADNELVALISKDHSYSLPPSSSLLLDLPGTTFQVPPLSGSTRLLNHHHTMYANGDKILHSSVNMEDISEHNITSEYMKKRKFKCFRSFVIKEKSIQVTRKWEENYNFNLDSRFTSDPKDKVVIRALHGPWNFTLQDTIEEVRLIFHMWIGLFYSRSTARFFQVDPTFMPLRLEESGSVEMASGILPGPTRPEIASALALSSQTETPDLVVSKTLDLRKKVNTVSVPESGILDLSVKSFNAKPVPSEQQLNKKATSVSSEPLKTRSALKPAADLQEKETFQWHKAIEHFKDISSEVKGDKDIKSKTIKTEHKALCYDHYETPSSKSDRTLCQREEINTVHIEPEPDGATFGTEPVFHGCSKEISITKVGIESGTATLKSLHQEDALCSPTSVTDKGVNSNIDDSNVMHTSVLDDLELKAKKSCKMGNSPCQNGNRDPCLDMTKTSDESVNKESDIVYNGSVVNEKLLNEKRGTSHDETDNLEGNMDCCAGLASKEVKSVDNFSKKDDVDEQSWESTSACKEENVDKTLLEPRESPSKCECSKSEESCPELRDGHSKFMEYTVNGTVENITEHITERGDSDESLTCDDNDALSEDGHIADPQTSIQCTVFNTGQKRSYSFLEQFSQRCLQNDITRASMEQECLIFLEKMKNLMKKSKREPLYQLNTYDCSMSCTSPLTVSFSSIEEEDDSVEILDTPLLRHKIKVDMSNSKDQTASKEEGKVLHSVSQERNNPMEHAGISTMTAECARLYNAKMHDVCSAKKVPPRLKTKKGHQGDSRTETSNHFDFCDQMKKELDETFRSNLNAVVKKSCKTKYRFYILVTSDEVFFKETKAQLEAEGHTAVQPSEFFLGVDSSSSLLIILRNEDIAEHICKIPDLLKLKMTPGVLFAGIDEPDDVLNLTHQELFTRAGFVMFDRAVLEPLSICNMKKISKNLEELSRMGKWKWMLHYRDSRRLKENARLSEEANQKKLFVYWCQDAGILEVLPYHECDQMTRDQPDYLECLLRLQVQHISSRFPVFITDTTTDSAFEKNGIFTMTLNTFLTNQKLCIEEPATCRGYRALSAKTSQHRDRFFPQAVSLMNA